MADRHREGYQKDYRNSHTRFDLQLPKELGEKLKSILDLIGKSANEWFKEKAEEEIAKFEKKE